MMLNTELCPPLAVLPRVKTFSANEVCAHVVVQERSEKVLLLEFPSRMKSACAVLAASATAATSNTLADNAIPRTQAALIFVNADVIGEFPKFKVTSHRL